MTIQVECHCGRKLAAPPGMAGKLVKCPACGTTVAIPASQAPAKLEVPPTPTPPPGHVRCEYCHEYVASWQYEQHAHQHTRLRSDGQQSEYATLPPEQREVSSEFDNAPRWYRHRKCGAVTGMPEEIIQTYLVNPWFYLADRTFCTGCRKHVRQKECVWEETGEDLQTYTDRLRAAKPQCRPWLPIRMLAAVLRFLSI